MLHPHQQYTEPFRRTNKKNASSKNKEELFVMELFKINVIQIAISFENGL